MNMCVKTSYGLRITITNIVKQHDVMLMYFKIDLFQKTLINLFSCSTIPRPYIYLN